LAAGLLHTSLSLLSLATLFFKLKRD